jgi:hypothetical protein
MIAQVLQFPRKFKVGDTVFCLHPQFEGQIGVVDWIFSDLSTCAVKWVGMADDGTNIAILDCDSFEVFP